MNKESTISTKEGQVAEQVAHRIDELAGNAHGLYARGKERAGEFRDSVDKYIQEQPMKSVFIAAGVGLCLGLLLSRR